jgi:sugar diacid utilization regulator
MRSSGHGSAGWRDPQCTSSVRATLYTWQASPTTPRVVREERGCTVALAHLLADPSITFDRRFASLLRAFEEVALETIRGSFVLDDALQLVGQQLCELLDVRRCSVYLRRDDGLFEARAGWCRGQDIRDQLRSLVAGVDSDAFTREIIATQAPVLVTDARHDPRTIQRTMERWQVLDMLGVPLVVDDAVIGIIFVDNEDEPHTYGEQEIAIAQAFAGLAAVAVRKGWLHSELDERTRVIDRQRLALEQLAKTDSRLTNAVLDGADLHTLLDLVRHLVCKPVLLYSPRLEVIAWSAPEDLKLTRPPEFTAEAADSQWLRRTMASARGARSTAMIPPAPHLGVTVRQLMCPLSIDGQVAGYLDVIELGRPLSTFDTKVLERAAVAVSLQMLTEHRQAEAEGQARNNFLADLFHGYRATEQLRRRAPLFGLDPAQLQVVVRVAYEDASGEETGAARRLQTEQVLRELASDPPTLLSTGVPGADLFLLAIDDEADALTFERRLSEGFDDLRELHVRHVLVSSVCRALGDLPGVASHLRELSELLREAGAPPQLALTRKLGLVRLASAAKGVEEARRFADRLLGPLQATDGEDGPLIQTLQAYFANHGNIRATSRTLEVHENTVRYRLARIREISGLNLDDLDELVDARFSLQLLELLGELPPPP